MVKLHDPCTVGSCLFPQQNVPVILNTLQHVSWLEILCCQLQLPDNLSSRATEQLAHTFYIRLSLHLLLSAKKVHWRRNWSSDSLPPLISQICHPNATYQMTIHSSTSTLATPYSSTNTSLCNVAGGPFLLRYLFHLFTLCYSTGLRYLWVSSSTGAVCSHDVNAL